MEENPFTITEKVIPEYFCDREKESELLMRLIANRNNVVLISPRRLGKTALIQYCFDNHDIKKYYYTFYIDILSTTNLQEFVFLLSKSIYSKLKPLGARIIKTLLKYLKSLSAKIAYDPFSGLPVLNLQLGDITDPTLTLEEIFTYLSQADKQCIVAIDEFQQISKYPEKGVEALIRSHILQINNCRFVFSGSERHILSEMFTNSSRPFYHSASFIDLLPIPKDIYVEFICSMFKKKTKKIHKELASEIYDKYDGITFCIQKICNIIFSLTPKEGEADEKMWRRAEEEILYSYDSIFREKLSSLTLRQKELLFAVSNEHKVDAVNSMDFIHRNSLASVSTVQSSMRALMNLDIISKEGNYYMISDRFFDIWIIQNYGK